MIKQYNTGINADIYVRGMEYEKQLNWTLYLIFSWKYKKRFKGNTGNCENLSIGVNLCDTVFSNNFMDLTSKSQAIKA